MNAHVRSFEGKPLPPASRQRRRFVERWLPSLTIFLMLVTLIGVVISSQVAINVPSGHVGVLWKRFGGGTVLDPRKIRDEGLHFIWPWDKLFLYDLRLQSITENYNVASSDGVSLTASVNIRFRLQRDGTPVVHQALGPNYVNIMIRPGIGSLAREVISQYTAEQVYSTARQEIQDKIREHVLERAGTRTMEREGEESYNVPLKDLFHLYDTLLYGIELPAALIAAINRKSEQYYVVLEYEFRVEREKRESERKKIEGEGIRDFQQIVTQGVTDSYLRWRGIEATLQLSQSSNTKVVIVGSGKDGLPILLGKTDAQPGQAQ